MRKQIFGRQLQRDINERKALFKSLMSSLILHETIKTTEAKAKAIRGQIEKLTTIAKKGGVHAERALSAYFATPVARKLLTDIAPRFTTRPGGYIRVLKTGNRLRDNAKMVVMEWVEKPIKTVKAEIMGEEKGVVKEVKEAKATPVKKETVKKEQKKKVAKKEEKK